MKRPSFSVQGLAILGFPSEISFSVLLMLSSIVWSKPERLLSRSLVVRSRSLRDSGHLLNRRLALQVRHFLWIAECIKEQFLMPIASYTLDGNLANTA